MYKTAGVIGGKLYYSDTLISDWKLISSAIVGIDNPNTNNKDWSICVMSASGQYQSAVVDGGKIYISSDYGVTCVLTN